jgi:hypothetical protein
MKTTGYPLHSPVSLSLPPLASPCAITFQLDSTRVKVEACLASLVGDTCELVMHHMVVIFGFTKVTEFAIFFFLIGGGGGVAKVFMCSGSLGVTGLHISPNLYMKVG